MIPGDSLESNFTTCDRTVRLAEFTIYALKTCGFDNWR
jgi:hypothetical protein